MSKCWIYRDGGRRLGSSVGSYEEWCGGQDDKVCGKEAGPVVGVRIKMYLSRGNMKMTIPTWSLPTGLTCPNATPMCRKHCYARKAERHRRGVLPCRRRNYEESLGDGFVRDMAELLGKRHKLEYVRIHEAGDFYNQGYLEKWFEICRRFPKTRFLAFSNMWDLTWKRKPDNMVVYWSVWPDTDLGEMKKYVDVGADLFAFVGESSVWKNDTLECPGHCDDCLMCFLGDINGMNVHFKVH